MQKKAIEARHLSIKFKNNLALDDISFTIYKGEIFGFLGPSGSGKTTTINILTGQIQPNSGDAFIFGKNTQKLSSNQLGDIGLVSDTSGYYEKMTLYNNLLFQNCIQKENLYYQTLNLKVKYMFFHLKL